MNGDSDTVRFVRHALILIALLAVALFVWRIAYALLLAFGGVLLAVFLRGLAARLAERTKLGIGSSFALVGLVLFALLGIAIALIGPSLGSQLNALSDTLTQGADRVRSFLEQGRWGMEILASMSQGTAGGGQVLKAVGSVFAGALDALLAFVLILFAGIYFAATPRVYTEGLVRLLPRSRRSRAREVLDATGRALWLWLLGQFVVMTVVGVLTALGLLVVGVPLALALGLIAGLLEFVPFLGPIAAAIPILLVALTVDLETALQAAVVLLVIQQLESHLFAPLVQRKAVALPPVLVLVGTIALTLVFGLPGAIFATPLLVVLLVVVKMLYQEDLLDERVEIPGSPG